MTPTETERYLAAIREKYGVPYGERIVAPAAEIGAERLKGKMFGFAADVNNSLGMQEAADYANTMAQKSKKKGESVNSGIAPSLKSAKSLKDKMDYLASKGISYAIDKAPVAAVGMAAPSALPGLIASAVPSSMLAIGEEVQNVGDPRKLAAQARLLALWRGIADAMSSPAEDAAMSYMQETMPNKRR